MNDYSSWGQSELIAELQRRDALTSRKIYWCEEAGGVFWLDGPEVMGAPMNNDSTAYLEDGYTCDEWDESPVSEAEVRAKLAK